MDAIPMERIPFDQLGLIAPILKALQEEGYTDPTPIQSQAIPHLLKGRDLLGCAQTGTGKTAAFAIPILQELHGQERTEQARRPIRSLILTPTRELAIQIGESFAAYGRHLPLRHTVVFGGVGQKPQTDALHRGVDILVATPGRLLDLMGQGYVDLKSLDIFVLDEADRMLDMGFIHDVRKVIAKLPAKRQTLLFSATMPSEIAQLANSILRDPLRVEVTPVSSTADTIDQCIYHVERGDKNKLLVHLLQGDAIKEALVFTRTKHGANKVAKVLSQAGLAAEAIHGNKSQTARQNALKNFKEGKLRALVATDIAARGIDIDGLSHVINFDLPNVPETYVHRIGRTGRAGAAGRAISFCDQEERAYLRDILRLIRRDIPVEPLPALPAGTLESPPAIAQRTGAKPAHEGRREGSSERPKRRRRRGGRPEGQRPSDGSQARSNARPSGGTRSRGQREGNTGGRPARTPSEPKAPARGQGGPRRERSTASPTKQAPRRNDADKLERDLFGGSDMGRSNNEKQPEKRGVFRRLFGG